MQNGIREGYWTVFKAAVNGTRIDPEELPFMASPSHIRHCIDLLRHSLMCQPDITIELKNEELGGVTGFGTEHQCKDWNQLMEWVARWEGWEQDPSDLENEEHQHVE
jgi:hypothetical protein